MKKYLVALLALVLFMGLALPALAQTGDDAAAVSFDWAWLNAVVAFFLPLAISLLKKSAWSTQTKKVFAFLVSAVVGVVTVGFDQGWAFTHFAEFLKLGIASITQIWVVAQVAYLSFWQETKPETALANTWA